jgi:large subunit ribosomal protein L13
MAEEIANKGGQKLANLRPTQHFTRHESERNWLVVDAKGQSVGRLCTQIANLLRGKHKPTFTPHDDVGDFVVVINAADVEFRGNEKAAKKVYYKYTGYTGNLKQRTGAEMLERKPEMVIKLAVKGMIPRGALGSRMLKKLKVYAGAEHPHQAQGPELFKLADSAETK